MAGDLNIPEYLTILDEAQAAEASAAFESASDTDEPASFIHRYGDRVLITAEPRADEALEAMPEAAAISASASNLSEIEQLGLAAFQLRTRPQYRRAKRNRQRDGHVWNMAGCAGAVQALPEEAMEALEAFAGAPTSAYLEGSVAVGIVIVEGPTADLQFSAAERTTVVAEVQNGLSWIASMNPSAGINFTYDIRV